ncbi:BatD family protein [Desulfobacterales bacterium HSG16]|nr:BatD family protein [Desulfobacterales bacterium HSG16]
MRKSQHTFILFHVFILWSILIFFPSTALCADEVSASVDRTHIAINESAQLTVRVNGKSARVDFAQLKDFRVISRGSSTEVNMINGTVTQEHILMYTLIPKKTGQLTVPALKVRFHGKVVETKPFVITVSKQDNTRSNEKDIFIETSVSNDSPYEGEQVVYKFKLYNSVRVSNANFLQKPEFAGFTAKELRDQKSYSTVISGREYSVTEVNTILVPLTPGEKKIDGSILKCSVVVSRKRNSRNMIDTFFDTREIKPRVVRSEAIVLKVKPLPENPEKVKFSGLIGKFSLGTSLDTKELKVGDSATLSIVISGQGNIMDAKAPEFPAPEDFKVYKESAEEKVGIRESGYIGKKFFRVALVPVKEGLHSINPVSFCYFDTSQKRYVVLSGKKFDLNVLPSEDTDTLEIFSGSDTKPPSFKKKVEFTGRDILALKEDMNALNSHKSMSIFQFLLYLAVPALLFGCMMLIMIVARHDETPAQVMGRQAQAALKKALAKGMTDEDFLASLHLAVISVVLSKAGIKGASLTYKEAETILMEKGYSDNTAQKAASVLADIESVRFGGSNMDEAYRRRLLSVTKELMGTLG